MSFTSAVMHLNGCRPVCTAFNGGEFRNSWCSPDEGRKKAREEKASVLYDRCTGGVCVGLFVLETRL